MKKIIFLLLVSFTLVSCNTTKQTSTNGLVRLNGTVEKLGMTTFQYGTHLLKADAKTYALKSSKVDLDAYVGKQVALKGTKVDGYPVENGPEFIEVTAVTVK